MASTTINMHIDIEAFPAWLLPFAAAPKVGSLLVTFGAISLKRATDAKLTLAGAILAVEGVIR